MVGKSRINIFKNITKEEWNAKLNESPESNMVYNCLITLRLISKEHNFY